MSDKTTFVTDSSIASSANAQNTGKGATALSKDKKPKKKDSSTETIQLITADKAIRTLGELLAAQPRNEHWVFGNPDVDPKPNVNMPRPIKFRDLAELEYRLEQTIIARRNKAEAIWFATHQPESVVSKESIQNRAEKVFANYRQNQARLQSKIERAATPKSTEDVDNDSPGINKLAKPKKSSKTKGAEPLSEKSSKVKIPDSLPKKSSKAKLADPMPKKLCNAKIADPMLGKSSKDKLAELVHKKSSKSKIEDPMPKESPNREFVEPATKNPSQTQLAEPKKLASTKPRSNDSKNVQSTGTSKETGANPNTKKRVSVAPLLKFVNVPVDTHILCPWLRPYLEEPQEDLVPIRRFSKIKTAIPEKPLIKFTPIETGTKVKGQAKLSCAEQSESLELEHLFKAPGQRESESLTQYFAPGTDSFKSTTGELIVPELPEEQLSLNDTIQTWLARGQASILMEEMSRQNSAVTEEAHDMPHDQIPGKDCSLPENLISTSCNDVQNSVELPKPNTPSIKEIFRLCVADVSADSSFCTPGIEACSSQSENQSNSELNPISILPQEFYHSAIALKNKLPETECFVSAPVRINLMPMNLTCQDPCNYSDSAITQNDFGRMVKLFAPTPHTLIDATKSLAMSDDIVQNAKPEKKEDGKDSGPRTRTTKKRHNDWKKLEKSSVDPDPGTASRLIKFIEPVISDAEEITLDHPPSMGLPGSDDFSNIISELDQSSGNQDPSGCMFPYPEVDLPEVVEDTYEAAGRNTRKKLYDAFKDIRAEESKNTSTYPPFSNLVTKKFTKIIEEIAFKEVGLKLKEPPNEYDHYCAKKYPKAPEFVKVPFRRTCDLVPQGSAYYHAQTMKGSDGLPNPRMGPTMEVYPATGPPIKLETAYEDESRKKLAKKNAVVSSSFKSGYGGNHFDHDLQTALAMVKKAIKTATPTKPPKIRKRPEQLEAWRRCILGQPDPMKPKRQKPKPGKTVGLFKSAMPPPKPIPNTGVTTIVFVVNGKPSIPPVTVSPYHLNTYLYPPKTGCTGEANEELLDRCTICFPCGLNGEPDPQPKPRNYCVTIPFPKLNDTNIFFSHDTLHDKFIIHGYRKKSRGYSYVNVTHEIGLPQNKGVLDLTIYRTDVGTLILHNVHEEAEIKKEEAETAMIMAMKPLDVLEKFGAAFFYDFMAKHGIQNFNGEF